MDKGHWQRLKLGNGKVEMYQFQSIKIVLDRKATKENTY